MFEEKNYVTVKLSTRTRWMLSIVPPSIFYCVGLYVVILIFIIVTYLSSGCQGRSAPNGAFVTA